MCSSRHLAVADAVFMFSFLLVVVQRGVIDVIPPPRLDLSCGISESFFWGGRGSFKASRERGKGEAVRTQMRHAQLLQLLIRSTVTELFSRIG